MSSARARSNRSNMLKNKELGLVEKIRAQASSSTTPRPRLGIGDDAAILPAPPGSREWIITTDMLVERSHFRLDRHPPAALGHKVLARGLSDIAAMGGDPHYALLSLCLPPGISEKWHKQFFGGLFRLARRFQVALVGGDLAAGDRLVADIVVLGSALRGQTLERARAKPGDILYVSGTLGGSALGFEGLRIRRPNYTGRAVRRHLYPEPRLALGRHAARSLGARAGIDLSDGLSIDLYRLTSESGVGAEVWREHIPVFPGATLEQALHGGEDYELLFTLTPRRKPPPSFHGIPVTAIGVITAARGLALVDSQGRRRALPILGFQHDL